MLEFLKIAETEKNKLPPGFPPGEGNGGKMAASRNDSPTPAVSTCRHFLPPPPTLRALGGARRFRIVSELDFHDFQNPTGARGSRMDPGELFQEFTRTS